MKNAIILLSGGLDSTTTCAVARRDGYRLHALSFDYGQRHRFELEAARNVAQFFQVADHRIFPLDLSVFGGSALTTDLDVPKDQTLDRPNTIPITYVPARNTIFLAIALAWAEVLPATDLFIGVNALDYSGYPDCRGEFIDAFQTMANRATRLGVEQSEPIRIHTPLLKLTKGDIIRLGTDLGVNYSLTHSCYDPAADGRSCGHCDACQLRLRGFREAGLVDPLPYVDRP
ncbi:MAG: 7-cyano-7-deazaguanine synthase QueC [FCB group bacterium]|nr:7-cyano-7-deazaguanine synthase QueC [FCB group bacterium]